MCWKCCSFGSIDPIWADALGIPKKSFTTISDLTLFIIDMYGPCSPSYSNDTREKLANLLGQEIIAFQTDSYDLAKKMNSTGNGIPPGWKIVDPVEVGIASYVWWSDTARIHPPTGRTFSGTCFWLPRRRYWAAYTIQNSYGQSYEFVNSVRWKLRCFVFHQIRRLIDRWNRSRELFRWWYEFDWKRC